MPFPSATDAKNSSKLTGSIRLPNTPRKTPFGPLSLWARTVVHPPVNMLRTGSTITAVDCGFDLKALKYARSAMLATGSGPSPDELTRFPSESKILTSPIWDMTPVLDFSIRCASGLDIRLLNASGEAIAENCIFEIRSFVMISQSSNCWSKWRVRSRTVFSSSRSLLRSVLSRNSLTVTTVPMMIAAIRKTPQRISHRTGPRLADAAA